MSASPLSLYEREEIAVALMEDRAVPWAVIGQRAPELRCPARLPMA